MLQKETTDWGPVWSFCFIGLFWGGPHFYTNPTYRSLYEPFGEKLFFVLSSWERVLAVALSGVAVAERVKRHNYY